MSSRDKLTELKAPHTVDLNPLGICNLRCPFCWGPAHDMVPQLTLQDWRNVITSLAKHGTRSIIFTGGEPLMYGYISDIVSHAKELQLRNTISTNGILLPLKGAKILPHIDEIGIPLDGSDEVSNNQLRISLGRINHFEKAINALHYLKTQKYNPNIQITVRTVVCDLNKHCVEQIGNIIVAMKLDNIRWKLYQFTPLSYGASVQSTYALNSDTFTDVVNRVRKCYPQLEIDALETSNQTGRYAFIQPDGEVTTIDSQLHSVSVGNIISDFSRTLTKLNGYVDPLRNQKHGVDGKSNAETRSPVVN